MGDFVRTDDSCKNWGFLKLIKGLKKWTESNPLNVDQRKESPKKERLLQTSQGKQGKQERMYCGTKSHEVFDCEKVKYISQRKKNSEQLGSSVTVVWEKDKRPLLA